MDHSELVAELPRIEKLTAADRLRIARDRRINQLRLHEQYERELSIKKDKVLSNQQKRMNSKNRGVRFILSVMLLEAAARNDTDEVRRLLMQGGNPDSTNEDGLTALHQCCIDDSESMMKLLLEFGANVNAEDSEKWTPLHAAATCGHLHLVKYLISKGANLLAVNADGNMPYDICEDEPTLDYIESEMARRGVTQELIDQTRASNERRMLAELKEFSAKGESLEFEDSVGARPLHVAAANGYLSVVEFLLDQHVATDAKDQDGWQPIHAAACWGHLEVVEMLVQNGSDLNAQTKNHETPFDICEDPDMKLRIAALRNEQENRARADHQKHRRSQSSSANTRTHSIRRNSTRDKGQISKKFIKDEAIFGIQNDGDTAQETDRDRARDVISAPTAVDAKGKSSDQNLRGTGRKATVEEHLTGTNGLPSNSSNSKRQAPPPPSTLRSENGSSTETSVSSKPHYLSPPYLTASALNDNTIDIRVSVTINTVNPGGVCRPAMLPTPSPSLPTSPPSLILRTSSPACHQPPYAPSMLPNILQSVHSLSGGSCTLSDLKKQRSQYRVVGLVGSANSTEYPAPNSFVFPPAESPGSGDVKGQVEPASSWTTSPDQNKTSGQYPSSDGTKKKFTGETELVGGGKTRDSSCCNLS